MKVESSTVKKMVMECTNMEMETHTRVNGKKIKNPDMESFLMPMGIHTLEFF